MMLKEDLLTLFEKLKNNSSEFFEHVSDHVHWTVMGTHPLAGEYHSKSEFIKHTFERLEKILKEGSLFEVVDLFIDGNHAIVEMKSISTANNGKKFGNTYCWIVTFENHLIIRVKAYVDSAMVQQTLNENE
jgi:ketosteroid isomerase-like protein